MAEAHDKAVLAESRYLECVMVALASRAADDLAAYLQTARERCRNGYDGMRDAWFQYGRLYQSEEVSRREGNLKALAVEDQALRKNLQTRAQAEALAQHLPSGN